MTRALFPGSFDPFTNGHLDIVTRAAKLFDEVVIGVGVNTNKRALFTDNEKLAMIEQATQDLNNTSVVLMDGLTANFAAKMNTNVLIRGVRNEQDFLYERNISEMNKQLTGIETVFLMTSPQNQMLSSSLIKEVAKAGGNVTDFLPVNIADALRQKLG
ncbi:pantetheine-phosphate adenylyltransferase [Weissella tructae]|uniref:Phosphopantetheine adenylyltransferase n=2 Tax=Weissella TaxID=46255 RepID=A0A075TZ13_9LACO|nr:MULTISPECIES: pantetheine-phosphate adenylyltransferase [Weissella]AIG65425.1 Phosphopantetheine adenylyltransferase [Weissella tructae]AIM62738.1 Phosphopantetheine adenylyltransferase [Weissella ceti]AIM64074.1 Phosphopantetheine adenylyltransferase [Weissella ceti]ELA07115.1 phosphopantetheine adenylyltransferase [Weissella ceti NC36]QVV91801.1 pantetheine-phosphate adenylyltransferase [Weissella tructae]